MSFYINKETLEVVELPHLLESHEHTLWIEYPYSDYEPEKYPLTALDSPDTIYGPPFDQLFNGYTPIQEIVDDLANQRNVYEREYPQFDFFVYEVELYDSDTCSFDQILQPYGCYKPTAERASKWYQEQKSEIDKRKEEEIRNINWSISLEEKKLEDYRKRLKELEK